MRKYAICLAFLTCINILSSCSSSENYSPKKIFVKKSNIIKKSIGINGMTCVGCEITIEKNISKIEGVIHVRASNSNNNAIIEFDSTKIDVNTIIKRIKNLGYQPFNE